MGIVIEHGGWEYSVVVLLQSLIVLCILNPISQKFGMVLVSKDLHNKQQIYSFFAQQLYLSMVTK